MAPDAATGKSILLVEDDTDIRESLRDLLELEGYRVSVSVNGKDALDYLSGHSAPSLILLDLMMPVMDGFEFRRKQADDPRIAGIPVVVMTADAHISVRKAESGFGEVIKKPLDLDSLLEVVARLCK